MAKKRSARGCVESDDRLFTLDVCIISGPMTEQFIKRNKFICRTIQILGDQTLEELHNAIFSAFDRWEQHMYEFQIGGKGPMDSKAKRYVLDAEYEADIRNKKPAGGMNATIASLGLKKGDIFGYWFDFGDDWWHQINVLEIAEKTENGMYPKVTKRLGESPPQYVDWDEEDG